MAKYFASVCVEGVIDLAVDAPNEAEAKKEMTALLEELNCGELRDVAWDLSSTEIECDNSMKGE